MLLVEAASQLIESAHSEQSAHRILALASRLIDADAYAIWSYDQRAGQWHLESSQSLSAEYTHESTIDVTDSTPTLHATMVVPDVDGDPSLADRLERYHAEGIRSMLVVALRAADGEANGSITFYYRRPHTPCEEDIRIAEALAGLASTAISMATFNESQGRINDQLGELNRRLSLIAQCSALLTDPLEQLHEGSAEAAFTASLGRITHRIVPAFADICVVDVFEAGSEPRRVETAAIAGVDLAAVAETRVREWRIEPGSDVTVSRSLAAYEHVLVPHVDDAWRKACAPSEQQYEAAHRAGATSYLMLPLVARGRVIGALSVVSVTVGSHFAQVDVAMLAEIARRMANALDTARLLDETRRIALELGIANAAKDEFLGLVSHELRTPLTIIRGNAEILSERLEGLDPQTRVAAVRDIAAEGERLQAIIDNMLLLARLGQGLEPEREPLLIVRVVEKLIARHQKHSPGRRFEISQSGSAQPVSFAEGYLEQVLENLISNADKYSAPSEPVIVDISRDSTEVRIRILDRGPGIGHVDAESLFDAFYRSDDASVRASGLGIGLAVCKRLVTAQGGRVWAAPRQGGGAEFGFSLPIMADAD